MKIFLKIQNRTNFIQWTLNVRSGHNLLTVKNLRVSSITNTLIPNLMVQHKASFNLLGTAGDLEAAKVCKEGDRGEERASES